MFAWTAASLLHVFLLSSPPCLYLNIGSTFGFSISGIKSLDLTHLENPAPICDNHSLVTLDGGNTGVAQLISIMNTMLWTWMVCIHIDMDLSTSIWICMGFYWMYPYGYG